MTDLESRYAAIRALAAEHHHVVRLVVRVHGLDGETAGYNLLVPDTATLAEQLDAIEAYLSSPEAAEMGAACVAYDEVEANADELKISALAHNLRYESARAKAQVWKPKP